jgi:rare lipoprotein A
VKVNDRGPFVDGRIIDLSRGAAGELDMLDDGVAKVRLYGVRGPGQEAAPTREQVDQEASYTVQVGSFTDEQTASELKERLSDDFESVYVTFALGKYYRVRVGHFDSRSAASDAVSKLQSMGFDTWLVREPPSQS